MDKVALGQVFLRVFANIITVNSPVDVGDEDPNTFPGLPNVGEPPKVGAPPKVGDVPNPDAPRSKTGEPPNAPVQVPYITNTMVCCRNAIMY
jgi:hypothetical protein